MESAALLSPSSDERLWINLRDRVDDILDDPKLNRSTCDAESRRGKRFTEDSMLLIKGLDSVSSSLSQLTDVLGAAQQGLNDLAKPSLRKSQKRESTRTSDEEDEQRKAKKRCGPNVVQELEDSKEEANLKENLEDKQNSIDVSKSVNLDKAKNLAMLMVSKTTSLAKELKMIRAELNFMQERCTLLEEENRRLRDGPGKGAMPDEDDLVRLQLEALLAEKSRLANENANLLRENQCLHQLVEYHQLTLENLTPSYEEEINGLRLDFSSPERKADSESDDHEILNAGELSDISNTKTILTSLDKQSNGQESKAAAA
ncbi:hypothetical protein KFK09_019139 [Dendrobium nobile]|uniref:Uncharacterized protein n=1 Tax=Dendrobium nobile TaxID=94219 RepID=A0A8T3AXV8_DENNO|nr:hypothetical protein KFK09_019139 [Dendrobium nobile]